jgi:glucose-1-phosphate cytidylyltransferase
MLTKGKDSIATSFLEKPAMKDWTNGGFMVFQKDFFNYLRPGEMEHPALKRLVAEKQLSLFAHEGFWHSMDTYSDVKALNHLWGTNPAWKVWKH